MPLFTVDLPNITILSGSSGGVSNVVLTDDVYAIGIQAPPLTSSQVTVLVSASSGTTTAFSQLFSGGSQVNVQTSGAIVVSPCPFRQLTLVSTVATEGATRTFLLTKTVFV